MLQYHVNPTALLYSLMVGLTTMVLLPLVFATLNDSLNLPVLDGIVTTGLGVVSMVAGVSLFLYCSALFKFKAKGTPMPLHPPKKLVASDIYAVTRNPIYLGYWLILLGEFLVFGQLLLLLYLPLFMLGNHFYVIWYEEPELRKRFDHEYEAYTSKVSRYFPRLTLYADR